MIDSAQSKKDDAQTEEPLEVLDEIKKYSTNVPLDTSPLQDLEMIIDVDSLHDLDDSQIVSYRQENQDEEHKLSTSVLPDQVVPLPIL